MPKETIKGELNTETKDDRLITKPEGFAVLDAAEIPDDVQPMEKHLPGSKMGDAEYEYVDISEATEGVIGRLREFYIEHSFPIWLLLLGVACLLVLILGQRFGTIVIALGFAIIAIAFVFFLIEAWKDKKKAEREYLHAKELKDAALAKLKEDDDGDDE